MIAVAVVIMAVNDDDAACANDAENDDQDAVSYTHLTLPTKIGV